LAPADEAARVAPENSDGFEAIVRVAATPSAAGADSASAKEQTSKLADIVIVEQGFGLSGQMGVENVLSPEQRAEYETADESRRSEIHNLLSTHEGQAALAAGAPLSSLRLANYGRRNSPREQDFRQVGYSLFALLVGYCGGSFARFVHRRRTQPHTN
jgi:hypothetical protein